MYSQSKGGDAEKSEMSCQSSIRLDHSKSSSVLLECTIENRGNAHAQAFAQVSMFVSARVKKQDFNI